METNPPNEIKETTEIKKDEQNKLNEDKDKLLIQDKDSIKELIEDNNENRKSQTKEENSERGSIPGSNGSNSYQNQDNPLYKNLIDSTTDLDKIVPGKDEGRLNSISYGSNEEKESQRKSDEKDRYSLSNFNFGNLYKDFGRRRTITRVDRKSRFMTIVEEEKDKNMKLKDIINAQLNEIKDNTIAFLLQTAKELEHRYAEYINNICDYIAENEIKINKVFQQNNETGENMLENSENNITQQIENLLEIHENIFNALEDHASLLEIFLEKIDLIQQKNPLEYFINTYSSNILNSWFLNKVNFQKLNVSSFESNKDLSELYTKYLIRQKSNTFKNFSITQDKYGNLSSGSDFIRQNLKNLEKLKFYNVKGEEINKIFEKNQKDGKEQDMIASKLKSLSVFDSNFSSTALNKLYTPSLKKLKIKRIILPLSLSGFFDSILFKSSFLQNLYLQKCLIDDESLSQIFTYLSEKPKLLESLQNISFAGNEITTVNMKQLIDKKCTFQSLEVLDFSKNSIYEFGIENFRVLQNIKILDLSDNNIISYSLFENVKNMKKLQCILFLCNNMFLSNNKNYTNSYKKYIYNNLENYNSKIKKINLTFLFDKISKNNILSLKLSPMIKISLIKLNLSYCGLDNELVCKFLNNNFGLLNLKILILSKNFIDLKFFELIKKIEIPLEKLECLDLSLNDIHSLTYEEYQNVELFVNKHIHLKRIKLQETIFTQDLLVLSQHEPEKFGEINRNLISKDFKFVVEKDNALLIEPLKDLFYIKDKEI